MAVGFYCVATLDVLGIVNQKLKDQEKDWFRSWIWNQHVGEHVDPYSHSYSEYRLRGRVRRWLSWKLVTAT